MQRGWRAPVPAYVPLNPKPAKTLNRLSQNAETKLSPPRRSKRLSGCLSTGEVDCGGSTAMLCCKSCALSSNLQSVEGTKGRLSLALPGLSSAGGDPASDAEPTECFRTLDGVFAASRVSHVRNPKQKNRKSESLPRLDLATMLLSPKP